MTEYVDSGHDEGSILGRSSGKIGFYGTTPVVKATVTQITTTVTGDDLAPTVKNIITALAAYGLIADA